MQWETIQIPNVYLTENWPIRYVSVNTSGHFIAIAGARGLAHYNTLSGKWKLFGNEHQEQSFAVQGGILWFRSMMIIACEDVIGHTSDIRVFSRETKLDNTFILHIERLQHPVLAMNNTDSHLMLYCADHVVRYFSIHVTANSHSLRFRPQQAFAMHDIVGGSGGLVQAIARFPPPGEISIETMSHNPFVILRNGILHMISRKGNTWEAIRIGDRTEHFWISAHDDEIAEFSNTMWAFSGATVKRHIIEPIYLALAASAGLQILTNIVIDPIEGFNASFLDTALHIVVDFYPLTVLIQKGLLVDEEGSRENQGGLLPTVIKFVQRFPRSLEIIVNCARKSEMALWKHFFSIVGDPKDMFKRCLDEGQLSTATSYLIIIQTLESSAVSSQLAVQLLEKSFILRDYETGSELVRFLRSIDVLCCAAVTAAFCSFAYLTLVIISGQFYFDLLVNKHARAILMVEQYRDLSRFALLFQLNLGEWLLRERRSGVTLVKDWSATFHVLHEQFNWPLPNEYTRAQSPQRKSSIPAIQFSDVLQDEDDAAGIPASATSATSATTLTVNSIPAVRRGRRSSHRAAAHKPSSRREEEIRYLRNSMQQVHPDMSLLLSAMLLDFAAIIETVDMYRHMLAPLQDTLSKTKSRGYKQLSKHLDATFAEVPPAQLATKS
eukprot:jgi/Hompol1/6170/HPOL_004856-RA